MPIFVSESDVWSALQVDLYDNDDSPPTKEPADRSFIEFLILAAQERFDRFCTIKLADIEGEIPVQIRMLINIDVATHYFNRINPELPEAYWNMLFPYRAHGFGGCIEDEDVDS